MNPLLPLIRQPILNLLFRQFSTVSVCFPPDRDDRLTETLVTSPGDCAQGFFRRWRDDERVFMGKRKRQPVIDETEPDSGKNIVIVHLCRDCGNGRRKSGNGGDGHEMSLGKRGAGDGLGRDRAVSVAL